MNLGSRLLVIVFAMATISLGLYSLRKEVKSVNRYLEKVSSNFSRSHHSWFSWLDEKDRPKVIQTSVPLVSSSSASAAASQQANSSTPKDPKKKKDLDKLTTKDKAELDHLIDKLSK